MELNKIIDYELMYIIVDYGKGSKILKQAKKVGIPGGTICLGSGTTNDSLLNFFSVYEKKKEIVLIGASNRVANQVLAELDKKFNFHKPNHGIAFTIPIGRFLEGRRNVNEEVLKQEQEDEVQVEQTEVEIEKEVHNRKEKAMYQLITTIVDRGKAEEVVEAANGAGAKGGTIMKARGSGTSETARVFNMEIEPEKEMVLILSKEETTDQIVNSIRSALDIDQPGKGILYIQEVGKTFGVYE